MIYRSGPQAQIRMAYRVWRYLRLKMKTNYLLMLWMNDLSFGAQAQIRMAYHVWRYLRLKMKTNYLLMLWMDDFIVQGLRLKSGWHIVCGGIYA